MERTGFNHHERTCACATCGVFIVCPCVGAVLFFLWTFIHSIYFCLTDMKLCRAVLFCPTERNFSTGYAAQCALRSLTFPLAWHNIPFHFSPTWRNRSAGVISLPQPDVLLQAISDCIRGLRKQSCLPAPCSGRSGCVVKA